MRGAQVLVATGRLPRTDGLNLAAAGVDVDERGFVVVDQTQRTSNPRVWAAGDVSGAPQYVYAAAAGGRAAALNALTEDRYPPAARVDYAGFPAVVFTRPQLASAGLTEDEALTESERLKRKWSAVEALVGAEQRLRMVAEDLVQHFEDRVASMPRRGCPRTRPSPAGTRATAASWTCPMSPGRSSSTTPAGR